MFVLLFITAWIFLTPNTKGYKTRHHILCSLFQPSSNYHNKFLEPPFNIILTSTLKEATEQIAISEFASGDTSLYFLFPPYKLHGPPTLYATPLLTLHIDKCYQGVFFVQNKSEYL